MKLAWVLRIKDNSHYKNLFYLWLVRDVYKILKFNLIVAKLTQIYKKMFHKI